MIQTSIAIAVASAAVVALTTALTLGPKHIQQPPNKPADATTAAALFIALMMAALGHYARSQGYSPMYMGSHDVRTLLIVAGTLFLMLGGSMVGGLAYLVTMGERR